MKNEIKTNSNWKGKTSGNVVNIDAVNEISVTYHVVQQQDGSSPDPNQWKSVTMPRWVFLTSFTHWID